MIHFFIGTKAQFIKMAPIMVELNSRNIPFRYVDSGQHAELTRSLRKVFGLREPDINLYSRNRDIVSIPGAVGWGLKLGCSIWFRRKWLRQRVFCGGGICLIHGDTLSTLLGMKMARAAGLKIGHVEAGLRSFCMWHPFPEELIRIYCMKRCDILFAPSEEAQGNLKAMNVRGCVMKVNGNTIVDALRLMEKVPATIKIPEGPFALATCHRLETITSRKRLEQVISLLNRVSRQIKVVFVTHKPTRQYLKRFYLADKLNTEICVLGMQEYMNFTALLRSAKMVITDGGSIQEECAYLNKPCLILRKKTERPDGLGKNAVLWGFEDKIVDEFLSRTEVLASAGPCDWPRPSVEIVDALIEYGGGP
ncbi:MAG: UDP-N-acetylglucosamine 2-epimerase [Sedimentisphaerales bacterium]|nr:UDP-N-acetylglucosamine 2-epimerase [Sedimentisphaerales bacterium]